MSLQCCCILSSTTMLSQTLPLIKNWQTLVLRCRQNILLIYFRTIKQYYFFYFPFYRFIISLFLHSSGFIYSQIPSGLGTFLNEQNMNPRNSQNKNLNICQKCTVHCVLHFMEGFLVYLQSTFQRSVQNKIIFPRPIIKFLLQNQFFLL